MSTRPTGAASGFPPTGSVTLVATTLANRDTEDFHETGTIPCTLNSIKDFLGHEEISTTIDYIESRVSSQRKIIKKRGKGK